MFNESVEGLVRRTILGGPWSSRGYADLYCMSEDSSSGSASFSESEIIPSGSGSASASESESSSEPPIVVPCGEECDECCYEILDLNELTFGGSENITYAEFPEGSNLINKVLELGYIATWEGQYNQDGYFYNISMNRVFGPVEFGGVVYGADGGAVFYMTIQSFGEFAAQDWGGVVEGCPTEEWVATSGQTSHGSMTLVGCSSSESGSASLSI